MTNLQWSSTGNLTNSQPQSESGLTPKCSARWSVWHSKPSVKHPAFNWNFGEPDNLAATLFLSHMYSKRTVGTAAAPLFIHRYLLKMTSLYWMIVFSKKIRSQVQKEVRVQEFGPLLPTVCSSADSLHEWWISNQLSQFAESCSGCSQIPGGWGGIIKGNIFLSCWGFFPVCLFSR